VRLSRRHLAAALAAAALCAGTGACTDAPDTEGPPDALSEDDAFVLNDARRGLDLALETEQKLSVSPKQARRLRLKVQEIVSEGAFETDELDEFGFAALGRLGLVAPSLVEADTDGVPESLDRPATRDFLRHAESDPARALLLPVREQVEAIEQALKRSEAGLETRIPPEDPTASSDLRVGEYMREAETDIRESWPQLTARLRTLREGL